MPSTLNIFPARVAIGRVTPSGDVMMTPEFSRALAALMVRVGGADFLDLAEIVTLFSSEPTDTANSAAIARSVTALGIEQASVPQMAARIAMLERRLEDVMRLLQSTGPAPTDWEHPGRLGDKTPNSARVTTLNRITFTQPATAATFTLADGKTFTATNSIALAGVDGKTFTLSNTLGLSGTDGAFLNIGTGGTLGSAAYQSTSAFAARTNTALAPVATDAASTQTLANSLRAALVSVGIGT
jgi:hypothetical protein